MTGHSVVTYEPYAPRPEDDAWLDEMLHAYFQWRNGTIMYARIIASHLENFRKASALRGMTWEEFCWDKLQTDPAFIATIERGVAVLRDAGAEAVSTDDVVRAAETAVPLREPGRPPKSAEENGSDRTVSRGETSDYLTRRIARDRPDVLERMKAGEFSSVRAAAIAAGIVKVDGPEAKALKAVARVESVEALERIADAVALRVAELRGER